MNTIKCEKARVDAGLVQQHNAECAYWRAVLERIVEVIKFLCERGLAFRGQNESIGSKSNGNYLGILELLSKFDPFLSTHIEKYKTVQEGGGRTVSYLSSTICNEFIDIMGKKVLDAIIAEIKGAKYYSISMDSTPDACNVDRCTVIFRYIPHDEAHPIERFVKFIGMENHTAQQLAGNMLQFFQDFGIDVKNCRGQCYDNASNMAGKYHGVQALVREQNPHAVYIPCFGHSLNLVGQEVVKNVPETTSFFNFLQNLYNFLSVSTRRWAIMNDNLDGNPVVKSLSQTRWSAHADATNALACSYEEIRQTLKTIEQNENEKPKTKSKAVGLMKKMLQLEYGILTELWATILERFNRTSISLQNPSMDLNSAVHLFKSLKMWVLSLRDQFDEMEIKGKEKSDNPQYKEDTTF